MSAAFTWRDSTFNVLVRDRGGVLADLMHGYVHAGLGIAHHGWGEPRTVTRWTLYHLGSGTRVCGLRGAVAQVFAAAWDIAALTDWTAFDLPDGWRNVEPELPAKVAAVLDALPAERVWWRPGDPGNGVVTADEARAFFEARDALAAELAR